MKKLHLWLLAAAAAGLPGLAAAAAFTQDCPSALQERLEQAKKFLIDHQNTLADDFEIDARRKGQERRSERQIMRRVEKIEFKCKLENDCDTHTAVQSVVGGNHIRICSSSLYNPRGTGAPFYKVVEVVAHEFGHNAHIPRARWGDHSRRGHDDPDRVYQFGYFARELAKEIYGMGFRVGEPAGPVRRPGLVPAYGIVLYPHKDFAGRQFGYSSSFSAREGRADFERWQYRHETMNDLRRIGRNEAASSIKVNSGRWQVCTKHGYRGNCRVVTESVSNLKDIDMNDKISSIRFLGP